MECEPNVEIDSDDSDDLPDIFEDDDRKSEGRANISAGDIIWAEFRKFYWPALVRKVHKKARKVSIWYLDSPRKCFKITLKKILSFKDPEVSKMIRKQVSESPMKEHHEKVLRATLTYIRRRASGCNDDPGEFFDPNIPYLSFKNVTAEGIGDIHLTPDAESLALELNTNYSENSDNESIVDSDENLLSRYFSVQDDIDDDIPCDVEKVDDIVSCILAGRTEKHLLAVRSGKTSSEFQKCFEDAMQTDRKKLWDINVCRNIKDLDKLGEISIYLLNLYEKVVKGGKCEMYHYVTSVWLPESIEKAISILDESKSPNGTYTSISSAPSGNKNVINSYNLREVKSNVSSFPESSLAKSVPKQKKLTKRKQCAQTTRSFARQTRRNFIETIDFVSKLPEDSNSPVFSSIRNLSESLTTHEETFVSELRRMDDSPKESSLPENNSNEIVPKQKKLKKGKQRSQATRSSSRKTRKNFSKTTDSSSKLPEDSSSVVSLIGNLNGLVLHEETIGSELRPMDDSPKESSLPENNLDEAVLKQKKSKKSKQKAKATRSSSRITLKNFIETIDSSKLLEDSDSPVFSSKGNLNECLIPHEDDSLNESSLPENNFDETEEIGKKAMFSRINIISL